MIPILYESGESAFVSNGLCRLRDIISCTVTEERNGIYECDFEYPVTGANYDLIKCGRIIGVVHDDSDDIQPFDIVSYTRPISGVVAFHAVHISYRQSKMVVSGTGVNSLSDALAMLKRATPSNPFNYWTDKTSSAFLAAADGTPYSVRQMLGGMEGSILDCYGGEYEWDKWSVKLWSARGVVRDFTIRYGVNLLDYNEDVDYSSTYTSCIPFWKGDVNGTPTIKTGRKVSSGVVPYDGRESCAPLDLSDRFESEPTTADLESMAKNLMDANQVFTPTQTIKVNFVRLQDSPDYASYEALLRCKLCDTISVTFPMYGMSGRFKIVKTVYNALEERFTEMELGTLSMSFAEALGVNSDSASYHGSGGGGGGAVTGVKGNEEVTYRTGNVNLTAENIGALPAATPIHNVPSGGSSGQVLTKNSGTDYDLKWSSLGGISDVQVNGTSVVSNNIANVPVAKSDRYGVVKVVADNDPPGGVVGITYHNSANQNYTAYAPLTTYAGGEYQPIRAKFLPDATQSVKGAMSAADKTKLDGIATGAEVNVQSNWTETDSTSDAFILNKPTIPTATSDLVNDSGFITSADLPQEYDFTATLLTPSFDSRGVSAKFFNITPTDPSKVTVENASKLKAYLVNGNFTYPLLVTSVSISGVTYFYTQLKSLYGNPQNTTGTTISGTLHIVAPFEISRVTTGGM